jgi:DDE domain
LSAYLGLFVIELEMYKVKLRGLQYVPRVIITDKLKSYRAAKREILPGVEHRQHKRLNNRAENSHQPTRLREKKMRKFKSAKQAQRFLSAFGPIAGHFQPRKHRLCARDYRAILQGRFLVWSEITGVNLVASPSILPSLSLPSSIFPLYTSSIYIVFSNKLTIPAASVNLFFYPV